LPPRYGTKYWYRQKDHIDFERDSYHRRKYTHIDNELIKERTEENKKLRKHSEREAALYSEINDKELDYNIRKAQLEARRNDSNKERVSILGGNSTNIPFRHVNTSKN